MQIEIHSDLQNLDDCPKIKAKLIAIVPDKRNLRDKSRKGGASNIDILADVKALDHISANDMPSIKSWIFKIINF